MHCMDCANCLPKVTFKPTSIVHHSKKLVRVLARSSRMLYTMNYGLNTMVPSTDRSLVFCLLQGRDFLRVLLKFIEKFYILIHSVPSPM